MKEKYKIIVCGYREFFDYDFVKRKLDKILSEKRKTHTIVIVSGGCRGADKLGEKYSFENDDELEIYKAEWDVYGKKAGPVRNTKMSEISDACVAFVCKKSKGTFDMIRKMKRLGKPVRVYWVE